MYLLFYVYEHFAYMYIFKERLEDSVWLAKSIKSHHVDSGNRTLALWEMSVLSHLSSLSNWTLSYLHRQTMPGIVEEMTSRAWTEKNT